MAGGCGGEMTSGLVEEGGNITTGVGAAMTAAA